MKKNILIKKHSLLNSDINLMEGKNSSSLNSNKSEKSLKLLSKKNNKYKNISNTFEALIKEEMEKFKIPNSKKEKLNKISLYEKNIPEIYEWNNLFSKSIPLSKYNSTKRDSINNKTEHSKLSQKGNNKGAKQMRIIIPENNNKIQNNNKKKKNNSNKIDYNEIDYSKGINVICGLPNESLNNYYKKIEETRKTVPELSPKIKVKNKNLQNEIKMQRILSFNKEIKLNILLSEESYKNTFKNEDLIIATKRKNADILIKSYYRNKDKNNKRLINVKTYGSLFNNNINKFRKRNKGLILSFYDERNPYIQKFNDAIDNMREKDKYKKNMADKDDIEVIKPTLRRNFSLDFNLNIKNSFNFEDNNDYQYMCESDERKTEKNRKIIQMPNNFFNNCKTTRNNDYLLHKDKEEVNFSEKKINTIKRPITSKNLQSNMHDKFGFSIVNINGNKKNIFDEFKVSNLIEIFPKKNSSKVGNYIYDRINTMIKSKKKLKLKLGKKKGAKTGLKGEDYHNKDRKTEEETKNNKNIPNHNHKDSKNNRDKKLNNFFF